MNGPNRKDESLFKLCSSLVLFIIIIFSLWKQINFMLFTLKLLQEQVIDIKYITCIKHLILIYLLNIFKISLLNGSPTTLSI